MNPPVRPLEFPWPLSIADRQAAIDALIAGGVRVQIGECNLYVDVGDDWIWGVDAYGQDALCGTELTRLQAAQALQWVADQHDPAFVHPAEFNSSL